MERRVRDQDDDLGRAAPPAQLGAAQQNLADSIVIKEASGTFFRTLIPTF